MMQLEMEVLIVCRDKPVKPSVKIYISELIKSVFAINCFDNLNVEVI